MKISDPKGTAAKPGVGVAPNAFKKAMSLEGGPKNGKLPPPLPKPHTAAGGLPGGVRAKTQLAVMPQRVAARPMAAAELHAPAQAAQRARANMNTSADQLTEARAQSGEANRQRYDTRLVDLICQELKIDFAGGQKPPAQAVQPANSDRPASGAATQQQQVATVSSSGQSMTRREAEVKAASAVQLIEKIEAFVKSSRPGLSITLDGSLGARVEIERLGPKEVALRLVGTNGPPKAEDIGRIRDEMRARGLKVGALSVA
jgi:hypothetical protein